MPHTSSHRDSSPVLRSRLPWGHSSMSPPADMSDLERKHIADVHEMYLKIHDIKADVDAAHEKIRELESWIKEDERASAWFYQNRDTIKDVASSAAWVKSTRAILLWLAGLIGGAALIWQTLGDGKWNSP